MAIKILICWLAVLSAACSTSPLGRKQLTFIQDKELNTMGIQAFKKIEEKTPRSTNAWENGYVQCVANAVTREATGKHVPSEWEVAVFQDDAVNAFALPGGKIGVNTGLLKVAENQHQLATVLGHEVAHVIARHGNERVSQQFAVSQTVDLIGALAGRDSPTQRTLLGLLGVGAQVVILLPYSRIQESESDKIGLDLMAHAGFDPRQSVRLWENMARASKGKAPEFLSTHPSEKTRIADLRTRMDRAMELRNKARKTGKNPRCHKK